MNSDSVRYYAVRRVNPYEGVLQVVETADSRAYSANGQVWQIQIIAERPDHTWRSHGHTEPTRQFFNFGLWDPEDGLHKVPANPVLDIGQMTQAADSLISKLHQLLDRLPFPLIDHFEQWATDGAGTPVALLATTEDRAMIANLRTESWRATRAADHSFVSKKLSAAGTPAHDDRTARQHAELLERRVRELGQYKTWYDRTVLGKTIHLGARGETAEECMPAFPAMGLKTDWDDPQTRQLAADYIDWLSPRLLMLPDLSDQDRRRLEQKACRRALELSSVYRLLPRVIDREAVEAARVEAELRRASR